MAKSKERKSVAFLVVRNFISEKIIVVMNELPAMTFSTPLQYLLINNYIVAKEAIFSLKPTYALPKLNLFLNKLDAM